MFTNDKMILYQHLHYVNYRMSSIIYFIIMFWNCAAICGQEDAPNDLHVRACQSAPLMVESNHIRERIAHSMPSKRITMQDIANACGLSRNTVSKAFNERGSVPQATKDLIFQKARELGYGAPAAQQFQQDSADGKTIALFTCNLPSDYHFGTTLVPSFTNRISRAGFTLRLYEISESECRHKRLPPHFMPSQTVGIVGIELFDRAYLDVICDLGLPTVMIDTPARAYNQGMRCDFISMENISSIVLIVKHLYDCGARRIGFVGDLEHCGSFNERWIGYNIGLHNVNLTCDTDCCILDSDDSPYCDVEWLMHRLQQMPVLPDAFVCANDYLAVYCMTALKRLGRSIPGDVMVSGFDGSAQSMLIEPALTTVQIPSAEIGMTAADLLMFRIKNPSAPFSWTHIKTTPLWRASTAGKKDL